MKESKETERTWSPENAGDQKAKTKAKHPIKSLNIATYNVRTLNGSGKQHQLTAGCNKFDIKILAIQEHRQIFEDQEVKYEWNDDGTWLKVLISANKDGTGGIGLFIERSITKSLQSVTKVCDRIIIATLDGNPQTTIVAVYAPTNAASDEDKESFYKQLYDVLTPIPVHNIVIVLGDFNARIGRDLHESNPRVYAYHQRTNENGKLLRDLIENNNLRPAFTKFQHHPGRLWTWEHPNAQLNSRAQLDHILISKKWINSVRNCRAYSSINIDSDHRIVCAAFKLSLRANKASKENRRVKYNWELLLNKHKQKEFEIEVKNQ